MSKQILTRPRIILGTEYNQFSTHDQTIRYVDEYHQSTLDSHGNYGYPNFPPDHAVGGAFAKTSLDTWYNAAAGGQFWRGGPLGQYYEGSLAAAITGVAAPPKIFDGSVYGASAYAKMKPTKPTMSGLNAFYELKDLPDLFKLRFKAGNLKEISHWHLGLQFGWAALAGDIANFVITQMKLQKRLAWLLKHNGKPIRTSVQMSEYASDPVTTSGQAYSAFQPVFVINYYASQPKWVQIDHQIDNTWAVARWKYWLPDGPRDITWTRAMQARIFGAYPSPSVVYKAMPWSWLNDWFSNTGTLLQNAEAGVANRLAADYFYMMRNNEYRREFTATGSFFRQTGEVFNVTSTSHSVASSKSRIAGDPFGFATNQNSLSAMQLSILGALGLSKLR